MPREEMTDQEFNQLEQDLEAANDRLQALKLKYLAQTGKDWVPPFRWKIPPGTPDPRG